MNRRNFLAAATAAVLGVVVTKNVTPSDNVPALLTPGEFVINKKYIEKYAGKLRGIQSNNIVYDEYASFNISTIKDVTLVSQDKVWRKI